MADTSLSDSQESPDTSPIEQPDTAANTPEARKARDMARLKQVAMRHGAVFLGALTLWGSAAFWAFLSGQTLVQGLAPLDAVAVSLVLAFLTHEWGHFAGARLGGAVSPVLKEPRSFFMFSFTHELNSRRQFLMMSAGGPLGNWFLVLLAFLLLPLETLSQATLLATIAAIAVNVSVFELPIIHRVRAGADPEQTLQNRLQEAGNLSRLPGIAVGLVLWLVVVF